MAELEMWEITPPTSFGPVSIKENRKSVRKKLGRFEPYSDEGFRDGDFFEKGGIDVAFDSNEEAIVIHVWSHARRAILEGDNLFEFSSKEFFDYCQRRNWAIYIDRRFGPENDELWRLTEQGIYVRWGGDNYEMNWVSVAVPESYGGDLIRLNQCPEWDQFPD